MKCDNCGFIPNPGDQVCMRCGARLSTKNAIVPGMEKLEISEDKKTSNKIKIIIGAIIGILLLALIVYVVIKILVLKR